MGAEVMGGAGQEQSRATLGAGGWDRPGKRRKGLLWVVGGWEVRGKN